jgi:hypothetical protein
MAVPMVSMVLCFVTSGETPKFRRKISPSYPGSEIKPTERIPCFCRSFVWLNFPS